MDDTTTTPNRGALTRWDFVVSITTDTREHAERVIAERLYYDEKYYETPDGEWWSQDAAPEAATTFYYEIADPVDLP